jgi:LmbE family N-acetylglucosaminyl deacetylase
VLVAPAAGDRHPDHDEAHHLVRRAVFAAGLRRQPAPGEPHRPHAVLYYAGAHQLLAAPAVVVDVGEQWPRLLEVIDCYASQLDRGAGDPATPLNSGDYRGWLAARATIAGRLIGADRGEALLSEQPLALTEPGDVLAGAGLAGTTSREGDTDGR